MEPVLIKFFKIIKLSKISSTNSLKSRKEGMKTILIENLKLEEHSLRLQRSLKRNKSLQKLRVRLNNELHKIELTKLNLWRILRMLMLKKKLKHLSINWMENSRVKSLMKIWRRRSVTRQLSGNKKLESSSVFKAMINWKNVKTMKISKMKLKDFRMVNNSTPLHQISKKDRKFKEILIRLKTTQSVMHWWSKWRN